MRDTSYPHGAHGLKERTRDKVNLMDGELLWEDGIQAPRNKKRFFLHKGEGWPTWAEGVRK